MTKRSEDGGDKWYNIAQECNEVAPEAKSKQRLKNRSEKLNSAPLELEKNAPFATSQKQMKKQTNVAANDARICEGQEVSVAISITCKKSPQGCSFAEFTELFTMKCCERRSILFGPNKKKKIKKRNNNPPKGQLSLLCKILLRGTLQGAVSCAARARSSSEAACRAPCSTAGHLAGALRILFSST